MLPRRSTLRSAALAAATLALAGCAGAPPPDPFAVGRLPATERAPVGLVALYAVPPADALAARVGPEGAALLEIAWEDAIVDAVASSFTHVRRVASLSRVDPDGSGDVVVAIALEEARLAHPARGPARVRLAWSVTSRTGGVLWSDSVEAEARGDGVPGLLAALRHAMVEGRRALLRQTLWRRYESVAGAPSVDGVCE